MHNQIWTIIIWIVLKKKKAYDKIHRLMSEFCFVMWSTPFSLNTLFLKRIEIRANRISFFFFFNFIQRYYSAILLIFTSQNFFKVIYLILNCLKELFCLHGLFAQSMWLLYNWKNTWKTENASVKKKLFEIIEV